MIQTNIKWYRPDEAMPREGTERVMVAHTFEGSTTTYVSTLHYSSKHKNSIVQIVIMIPARA